MTTRPASSDIRLHRQRAQDGQVCGRESPTLLLGRRRSFDSASRRALQKSSTIDSGASDSRCPASTREHQRRIIRMKYAQTSSEATGSPKGVRWSHPDFLRRISTRGAMLTALRGLAVVGRRFPMPQTVAKLWTASRKRSPICLNSAGERMRMRGVESNR